MKSNTERLASFVMPRLDASKWGEGAYRDAAFALVDRGIGGFGVFLGTLEETAAMIEELNQRSGNSLLFGADYEHGLAMRITEGGIAFPRAMAMGKTLPGITEHCAGAIAIEARTLGVHWNWAPVCDINSDTANPIVNTRAYGEDPDTVTEHATAFVRGTQKQGVMACAKHVPGHGATTVDSHVDLPTIDVDLTTAEKREFAPFQACVKEGVDSLMMGHILMPSLDAELPASMSEKVISGLVREKWGFEGIITTDALDMGAVTKQWSSADAAVNAFVAGNDVLLLPADPNEAIDGLIAAFDDGRITEERLAESEERLKAAREKYLKVHSKDPVDQNTHAMMALKAADGALRLEGKQDLLPITKAKQIAAFAVVDEHEMDTATTWFHYLAQATELNIDFGFINGEIEERDLKGLMEGTEESDLFVFAFFGSAVAHRGALPGQEKVPAVMEALHRGRSSVAVVCGSPYGIEQFSTDLKIFSYSDTTPSLAASVLRLIGRSPA